MAEAGRVRERELPRRHSERRAWVRALTLQADGWRGEVRGLARSVRKLTSSGRLWVRACRITPPQNGPPHQGGRIPGERLSSGEARAQSGFDCPCSDLFGHSLLLSTRADLALSEVNVDGSRAKEIQSQQTVNARTWRQRMGKDRKVAQLLPQCPDPRNAETRSVFNPATGRHLHTIRRQRWVVADGRERSDVDHCARRAGVQCKAQNDTTRRPEQLGLGDDESALRVEGVAHSTTAVSSGISPV